MLCFICVATVDPLKDARDVGKLADVEGALNEVCVCVRMCVCERQGGIMENTFSRTQEWRGLEG